MKVEDLSLTPELAKLTRQVLVSEHARTEDGAALRCTKRARRMDATSVTGVPGVALRPVRANTHIHAHSTRLTLRH
jgi:hypothetical protein